MKFVKYIVVLLFVGVMTHGAAQPPVLTKVEGGRRVGSEVDSVLFAADSMRRDSIQLARALRDSLKMDSVEYAKFIKDSLRKANRFDLTRDTISPGALLGLSFVPGLGQIYNKQYWKTPTFVGLMGGFAAGGIAYGNAYSQTRSQWMDAVNLDPESAQTASLREQMYDQQSASTIFYALAGATYLYSIADATFNYRGKMSHIRKATTLAAIFPGAGFFYTRTYWRIPIYYGAFAVTASVIDFNNRYYERFKTAYNLATDDDPATVDEFGGRYSSDVLKNARDGYRRNRDFGIICTAAVYLLSIIDTYVIATLKNWDVSPDLSVMVTPTMFNESITAPASFMPTGAGLSLRLNF